jgi:hypothetical protein
VEARNWEHMWLEPLGVKPPGKQFLCNRAACMGSWLFYFNFENISRDCSQGCWFGFCVLGLVLWF